VSAEVVQESTLQPDPVAPLVANHIFAGVLLRDMWRALRVRNSGLVGLKADPLIDPLRNESRFQAIGRSSGG